MSTRMIEALNEQIDTKNRHKDMLGDRAAEEGRDLNDQEQATIDALNIEIKAKTRQLELLVTDTSLSAESQARIREITGGLAPQATHYRTAGDLLWDVLHQNEPDAQNRYRNVLRRAAQHMGTVAASTTPTAGDLAGLIVKPVVGPVINPYPQGMPFATAVGMRDIPPGAGFGFIRPKLVDAAFTTGAPAQSAEKAELSSTKFNIGSDTISLTTYGNYLNISQQLLSFNAAALQIVVDELRARVEYQIDKLLVTEMQNSTGKVTTATGTLTAAVLNKAIWDGVAAYYAATFRKPTWMAMGPLGWARLGATVDTAGRPLIPPLSPFNAVGTMNSQAFGGDISGLQGIVTPVITDDSYWIGGNDALEGYLYRFPVLEAVEPSVLGRQVAIAVAVGTFRPSSFPNALIHLAP